MKPCRRQSESSLTSWTNILKRSWQASHSRTNTSIARWSPGLMTSSRRLWGQRLPWSHLWLHSSKKSSDTSLRSKIWRQASWVSRNSHMRWRRAYRYRWRGQRRNQGRRSIIMSTLFNRFLNSRRVRADLRAVRYDPSTSKLWVRAQAPASSPKNPQTRTRARATIAKRSPSNTTKAWASSAKNALLSRRILSLRSSARTMSKVVTSSRTTEQFTLRVSPQGTISNRSCCPKQVRVIPLGTTRGRSTPRTVPSWISPTRVMLGPVPTVTNLALLRAFSNQQWSRQSLRRKSKSARSILMTRMKRKRMAVRGRGLIWTVRIWHLTSSLSIALEWSPTQITFRKSTKSALAMRSEYRNWYDQHLHLHPSYWCSKWFNLKK